MCNLEVPRDRNGSFEPVSVPDSARAIWPEVEVQLCVSRIYYPHPEQLLGEERASILDLGAGTGFDGPAFVDAGLRYVGVDLAHANCRLAADQDIDVVHGSIGDVPIRRHRFDAG